MGKKETQKEKILNTHTQNQWEIVDKEMWRAKAAAFVTRAHRHLWGKNNEDPLAFLFLRGLENRFAKDMIMGWNKFGQKRSPENWGLCNEADPQKKLFLPAGIVVPYIVQRTLKSVFIHSCEKDKTYIVPGSSPTFLTLEHGPHFKKTVMTEELFKGLVQFQNTETIQVIIQGPFSFSC